MLKDQHASFIRPCHGGCNGTWCVLRFLRRGSKIPVDTRLLDAQSVHASQAYGHAPDCHSH